MADSSAFNRFVLNNKATVGGHTNDSAVSEWAGDAYDAGSNSLVLIPGVQFGGKTGTLVVSKGNGVNNMRNLLGLENPRKKGPSSIGCRNQGHSAALLFHDPDKAHYISRPIGTRDIRGMDFDVRGLREKIAAGGLGVDYHPYVPTRTLGLEDDGVKAEENWTAALSTIKHAATRDDFAACLSKDSKEPFLAFWLDKDLTTAYHEARTAINVDFCKLLKAGFQVRCVEGETVKVCDAASAISVVEREGFPSIKIDCCADRGRELLLLRIKIPGALHDTYATVGATGGLKLLDENLSTFTAESTLSISALSKDAMNDLAAKTARSIDDLRGVSYERNGVLHGPCCWPDSFGSDANRRNAGGAIMGLEVRPSNMDAERNRWYSDEGLPIPAIKHTTSFSKAWPPYTNLLKIGYVDLLLKCYTGATKQAKNSGVTAWDERLVLTQLGLIAVPAAAPAAARAVAVPSRPAAASGGAGRGPITPPSKSSITGATKDVLLRFLGDAGLSTTTDDTNADLRERLRKHYYPENTVVSAGTTGSNVLTHVPMTKSATVAAGGAGGHTTAVKPATAAALLPVPVVPPTTAAHPLPPALPPHGIRCSKGKSHLIVSEHGVELAKISCGRRYDALKQVLESALDDRGVPRFKECLPSIASAFNMMYS
jgi:hypothetical protein